MQPPVIILPDTECSPQAEMSKKKDACTPEEVSRVMRKMVEARNRKLSAERRKEIATNAAIARWKKKKP